MDFGCISNHFVHLWNVMWQAEGRRVAFRGERIDSWLVSRKVSGVFLVQIEWTTTFRIKFNGSLDVIVAAKSLTRWKQLSSESFLGEQNELWAMDNCRLFLNIAVSYFTFPILVPIQSPPGQGHMAQYIFKTNQQVLNVYESYRFLLHSTNFMTKLNGRARFRPSQWLTRLCCNMNDANKEQIHLTLALVNYIYQHSRPRCGTSQPFIASACPKRLI